MSDDRTVRLHRALRCPPERVYRAFTDPAALAKWLPPRGFVAEVHEMDVRVGGRFRMAFRNFSGGGGNAFGGEYLELVPGALIRYTDVFDDPALSGELQVRVEIAPALCGCELHIAQSGIPEAIPLAMCYLGWQESLSQLADLVEPEIPAG